jgi:pimeloyl-ACP methyl ester carboxylesterase/DNA-binding winged helix-turn-helix (wHTH) protein
VAPEESLPVIHFGDFHLDTDNHELRCGASAIALRPKSFRLLSYMAERPGKLLTRDELLDVGWARTAVSEGVLKVCIREIREALGDDPVAPRYVQTVHRVGYRFLRSATEVAASHRDSATHFGGQVEYAKSGDVHIAYRSFGNGPRDIVLIPGTLSHVELLWEIPTNQYLLKRLTAFARVIVFDKRGQGLSDRVAGLTIEERMDDVRAVMDAAGSKRATIYGWSEGGTVSLIFAATYPERTSALVLYATYACMRDGAWTVTPDEHTRFLGWLEKRWGQGALVKLNAPSRRDDQEIVKLFGDIERASASPGSIQALLKVSYEGDARPVLRSLSVPTLILHRAGDRLTPVTAGRYLAAEIPGAKYVELPGGDHMVLDRETQDAIANEIEKFIIGARSSPERERALVTLMYAGVEESCNRRRTAREGESRERLIAFKKVIRRELMLGRGRQVCDGDTSLMAFDGPARAVRCACAVQARAGEMGLLARIGLHTGECEVVGETVSGVAVQIAEHVARSAEDGEVLVSGTVRDLVAGSGIRFLDRGARRFEGALGEWRLFAVH